MKRSFVLLGLAAVLTTTIAAGDAPVSAEDGKKAFVTIARVLQSPRCMNCHPAGDAPLQTDRSRRHAMNISRASAAAGLACATCHQGRNSDVLGIRGGPPGAPHWDLPPKEAPMVFEGRNIAALCAQLRDPEQNGHRSLDALLAHVDHDALVLWGWDPGEGRTKPPVSHDEFVGAFRIWVQSQGACPP